MAVRHKIRSSQTYLLGYGRKEKSDIFKDDVSFVGLGEIAVFFEHIPFSCSFQRSFAARLLG